MKTVCPECQHSFKVKQEWEGKKVKCPKCSKIMIIKIVSDETDDQNQNTMKKKIDKEFSNVKNTAKKNFSKIYDSESMSNAKNKAKNMISEFTGSEKVVYVKSKLSGFNLATQITLFAIIIGILIWFGGNQFTNSSIGNVQWFDYGNGMINLNNYTHINPTMEVAGLGGAIAQQMADSLNMVGFGKIDVKNAMNWDSDKFDNGKNYTILSAIKFDNFTLTVDNKPVSSWDEYVTMKNKLMDHYQDLIKFIKSGKSYHKFR